ncbi:MAG: alpha/beta fold hydrolase [Candidatus Odinarchaeota archaeon]
MNPDTTETRIKVSEDVEIACSKRTASSNRAPIVFIHGFGSSKEHFKYAFTMPSLESFTLIALDLLGFGQSTKPDDFSYSMGDHARVILEVLDQLQVVSFHLCAHSMGGLIGIEMAELVPNRVKSFTNLEGNLTPEDCFFSGKIIETSYQEFVKSTRKRFDENLEEEGKTDPSLLSYLESFRQASSVALYRSAEHTVRDSNDPRLIERFICLDNKSYVYGEKNKEVFPAEKILLEAGMLVYYVENAGHNMAEENPKQLYGIIKEFCTQYEDVSG